MKKTSKPTVASPKRSPARPRPRRQAARQPVEAALVAFAALAKREQIRWYVFGAQAVALHGVPRMTADLDITIDLGDRPLQPLIAKLVRAGFDPRFADAAFAVATRVFPVVHRGSALPIDLVLAGPGLEQRFLDRVEIHTVARHRVPVLAVADLVVTKVLAGRPKDLEDVRQIIGAHPKLDHESILQTLAEIEDALGQSDLRPIYRRLRTES